MKKIILSASMLGSFVTFAQNTGIGTTKPDASAKLEVSATNQGVLVPRITLSSTTVAAPVTSPANGLTVFNTATAGDVSPGYYYWDGSKWVRLLDGKTTLPSLNIYNSDGTLTGNRTVNQNSNNITWNSGEQIYTNPNAFRLVNGNNGFIFRNDGTSFYMLPSTASNGMGSWNSSRPFTYNFASKNLILNETDGNVGIGIFNPLQKLHVNGAFALVQGSGNEQAYIGGDGAANDVQVGSLNTAVNDIAFFNAASGKYMNTSQNNVQVNGTANVGGNTTLNGTLSVAGATLLGTAATGASTDNILVRAADGTVKQVTAASIIAANSANIYNTDGNVTANRLVSQNGKTVNFDNGSFIAGNNTLSGGSMELNSKETGNRTSYIDFHASDAVDYSARIIRNASANGSFEITNWGTGSVNINNSAYVLGTLGVGGFDFSLGGADQASRGNSGGSRALVKMGSTAAGSTLFVNYANDFTAGTRIDSKLFITNTTGATDAANDKVLTISNTGEVKNSGSTVAALASSTEPWYNEATNTAATANNQNIYQTGNVTLADGGALNASGNKLFFGRGAENTDPLSIYRYNGATDHSEIRMSVGDNDATEGPEADQLVIGNTTGTTFNEKVRISGSSGQIKVGAGSVGTQGVFQILPNQVSPFSTRLLYGTDDSGWKFSIGKNKAGTVTDQFVIQDNGNVGIGTSNPAEKLDVAGNIQLSSGAKITAPGRLHITGDEQLYILNKNGVRISKSWSGDGSLAVEGQATLLDVPTGSATDNVLVRGSDGIVKQVTSSAFTSASAWSLDGNNADGVTKWAGTISATPFRLGAGNDIKLTINPDNTVKANGSIYASQNNSNSGGFYLADDGSIVDNNDGYASMRFTEGIRVTAGATNNTVTSQISANGANPTYFNSGNVGIGTATPGARLTIAGGAADISYGNGGTNTLTRANAGLRGDAGARSGFFETSAAEAAGSNYPAGASGWWHLLDNRHSNNANNNAMQFANGFGQQKLFFRDTANNPATPWSQVLTQSQANGTINIGSNLPTANGGNVLTIDAAGNITQTPASTLTISPVNIYNTDGTVTGPRTVNQNGNAVNFTNGQFIASATSFNTGAIELNQLSSGDRNTFIDFHSAQAANTGDFEARIIRAPGANGAFEIANTGGADIMMTGGSTNVAYLKIRPQDNGNEGGEIQFLGAPGKNTFQLDNYGGGARLFGQTGFQVTSDLTVTGTIYQTSDARFKKDVQTLRNGISTISALRPVTYKWNDAGVKHGGEAGKEQIGFIAQEIEKVLPSAVQTDAEGNKSVNYSQVIPVLTQSVQELKKENDKLKKRLEKIEALLNAKK